MNRRTFIKQAAIGSIATGLGIYLPGCASSAKNTWECSGGVCVGKGLMITKIDDQKTEVKLDVNASMAARDSRYFNSPLLTWSSAMSVGVKQMDNQHINWIYIINTFHEAMKTGNGDKVLEMIFNGVLSFSKIHFADEEALLAANGYPGLPGQKYEHDNFVKQVIEYKKKFESGQMLVSMDLMVLLKAWVQSHIMQQDKQYGVFLNAKGIY